MILSTFDQVDSYRLLGPRFAAGLDWIARYHPEIPDGRHAVATDDVYALVQSYATLPPAEKKYESHRCYADIQFIVSGQEVIQYAPIRVLLPVTNYDAGQDCILYADPADTTALHLGPGCLAIFLPADGHKPGCVAGSSGPIRKVVVKVRL